MGIETPVLSAGETAGQLAGHAPAIRAAVASRDFVAFGTSVGVFDFETALEQMHGANA